MDIAIIGGVERNETAYRDLARAAGHVARFHSGHDGGRFRQGLQQLVRRSDLVVVITEVNSHNAVTVARRLARGLAVPILLQRTCSPTRFAELLATLPPAGAPALRAAS